MNSKLADENHDTHRFATAVLGTENAGWSRFEFTPEERLPSWTENPYEGGRVFEHTQFRW